LTVGRDPHHIAAGTARATPSNTQTSVAGRSVRVPSEVSRVVDHLVVAIVEPFDKPPTADRSASSHSSSTNKSITRPLVPP
jgi:hypothetical protein